MPAQLKRLIPLFAIFIGLFIFVRHFLVPDSFGQFGHYRGNSLQEIASKEMVFASRESCYDCHDDMKARLENNEHSELSCVICHGPGLAHMDDPWDVEIVKMSGREFCGRCHNLNAARQMDVVFQVDIHTHHPEKENCIECHNPHDLWEAME